MAELPTKREMLVKRAIIEALDELLTDKSFDDVQVQDICEKAQVSRTTFYRHFRDKYDLVNWTYEHYKDVLNKRGSKYEVFDKSIVYLLEFMQSKRNFFLKALRYTGQNSLAESIIETIEGYMIECYEDAVGKENVSRADLDLLLYQAGGQAAVAYRWLFEGCPIPPDELGAELCSFIPDHVHQALK